MASGSGARTLRIGAKLATTSSDPEFICGDQAMIVSPVGDPPWPDGPVLVLGCVLNTPNEAAYVVQFPCGRQEAVDGVELVPFDSWVEWMRRHAN